MAGAARPDVRVAPFRCEGQEDRLDARNRVVIAGDGQVTMGNTVVKANAKKLRRLGNGSVIGRDFVRGPSLPAAGIPQTATNP